LAKTYKRMPHTSVSSNLLQSFQIFSEFVVKSIGKKLRILSIHNITLSVEEPLRNLVLRGILKDSNNTFEFFSGQLSGSITLAKTLLISKGYRLLRSTSAFLITTLAYRRPTPLILVNANMIFSFPSTFVFRRRRMCWKAFLSGTTRAILERRWRSTNFLVS